MNQNNTETTQTPSLKRRGRPCGKAQPNTIEVPLVELIRMFKSDATIQVGRKWILARGYKGKEEVVQENVVETTVPQVEKAPVVTLKIVDPTEEFAV